jgi:SAM-dependent methyltransferase
MDERADKYRDLHSGQLSTDEIANRYSAHILFEILFEYLQPKSVLDIGCGLGTWLSTLNDRGVPDLRGVDGPWFDPVRSMFDPGRIDVCDLEQPIDLGRTFDLVVSVEVAEHISASSADVFVASLVRHAPVVMFSAAIPRQGGTHHVNEQYLSYWAGKFAGHNYQPVDIFRGRVWHDERVHWWLRQNLVLFARRDLIAGNQKLKIAAEVGAPLSIVHPDVYRDRVGIVDHYEQLEKQLAEGGLFASWARDGMLYVRRVGDLPEGLADKVSMPPRPATSE